MVLFKGYYYYNRLKIDFYEIQVNNNLKICR
jgi:hypothetical protein